MGAEMQAEPERRPPVVRSDVPAAPANTSNLTASRGTDSLLALQCSAGNRAVTSLINHGGGAGMVVMRDPDANAVGGAPAATAQPDSAQVADTFEADAMAYFEDNMRMELRNAAGVEGVAFGRRASLAAQEKVRDTVRPYEESQEIDTNIMNTVFAVTGGGQAIGEGFSSGYRVPAGGGEMGAGSEGAAGNVFSRVVRATMGLVNVWMPTLAGYKTVGQLKNAAMGQAGEQAAQGGETGSGTFQEYENTVLDELHKSWTADVAQWKATIIRDQVSSAWVAQMVTPMLSVKRSEYLNKLRTEWGAAGPFTTQMVEAIDSFMTGRLAALVTHLEEAKEHRKNMQALGVLGGATLGGAAIGTMIAPGIGTAIGAGIGAIVGGIGGAIIKWG